MGKHLFRQQQYTLDFPAVREGQVADFQRQVIFGRSNKPQKNVEGEFSIEVQGGCVFIKFKANGKGYLATLPSKFDAKKRVLFSNAVEVSVDEKNGPPFTESEYTAFCEALKNGEKNLTSDLQQKKTSIENALIHIAYFDLLSQMVTVEASNGSATFKYNKYELVLDQTGGYKLYHDGCFVKSNESFIGSTQSADLLKDLEAGKSPDLMSELTSQSYYEKCLFELFLQENLDLLKEDSGLTADQVKAILLNYAVDTQHSLIEDDKMAAKVFSLPAVCKTVDQKTITRVFSEAKTKSEGGKEIECSAGSCVVSAEKGAIVLKRKLAYEVMQNILTDLGDGEFNQNTKITPSDSSVSTTMKFSVTNDRSDEDDAKTKLNIDVKVRVDTDDIFEDYKRELPIKHSGDVNPDPLHNDFDFGITAAIELSGGSISGAKHWQKEASAEEVELFLQSNPEDYLCGDALEKAKEAKKYVSLASRGKKLIEKLRKDIDNFPSMESHSEKLIANVNSALEQDDLESIESDILRCESVDGCFSSHFKRVHILLVINELNASDDNLLKDISSNLKSHDGSSDAETLDGLVKEGHQKLSLLLLERQRDSLVQKVKVIRSNKTYLKTRCTKLIDKLNTINFRIDSANLDELTGEIASCEVDFQKLQYATIAVKRIDDIAQQECEQGLLGFGAAKQAYIDVFNKMDEHKTLDEVEKSIEKAQETIELCYLKQAATELVRLLKENCLGLADPQQDRANLIQEITSLKDSGDLQFVKAGIKNVQNSVASWLKKAKQLNQLNQLHKARENIVNKLQNRIIKSKDKSTQNKVYKALVDKSNCQDPEELAKVFVAAKKACEVKASEDVRTFKGARGFWGKLKTAVGGFFSGAIAGAGTGAAVGALALGVGAIPGAIVGFFAGGYLGAVGGTVLAAREYRRTGQLERVHVGQMIDQEIYSATSDQGRQRGVALKMDLEGVKPLDSYAEITMEPVERASFDFEPDISKVDLLTINSFLGFLKSQLIDSGSYKATFVAPQNREQFIHEIKAVCDLLKNDEGKVTEHYQAFIRSLNESHNTNGKQVIMGIMGEEQLQDFVSFGGSNRDIASKQDDHAAVSGQPVVRRFSDLIYVPLVTGILSHVGVSTDQISLDIENANLENKVDVVELLKRYAKNEKTVNEAFKFFGTTNEGKQIDIGLLQDIQRMLLDKINAEITEKHDFNQVGLVEGTEFQFDAVDWDEALKLEVARNIIGEISEIKKMDALSKVASIPPSVADAIDEIKRFDMLTIVQAVENLASKYQDDREKQACLTELKSSMKILSVAQTLKVVNSFANIFGSDCRGIEECKRAMVQAIHFYQVGEENLLESVLSSAENELNEDEFKFLKVLLESTQKRQQKLKFDVACEVIEKLEMPGAHKDKPNSYEDAIEQINSFDIFDRVQAFKEVSDSHLEEQECLDDLQASMKILSADDTLKVVNIFASTSGSDCRGIEECKRAMVQAIHFYQVGEEDLLGSVLSSAENELNKDEFKFLKVLLKSTQKRQQKLKFDVACEVIKKLEMPGAHKDKPNSYEDAIEQINSFDIFDRVQAFKEVSDSHPEEQECLDDLQASMKILSADDTLKVVNSFASISGSDCKSVLTCKQAMIDAIKFYQDGDEDILQEQILAAKTKLDPDESQFLDVLIASAQKSEIDSDLQVEDASEVDLKAQSELDVAVKLYVKLCEKFVESYTDAFKEFQDQERLQKISENIPRILGKDLSENKVDTKSAYKEFYRDLTGEQKSALDDFLKRLDQDSQEALTHDLPEVTKKQARSILKAPNSKDSGRGVRFADPVDDSSMDGEYKDTVGMVKKLGKVDPRNQEKLSSDQNPKHSKDELTVARNFIDWLNDELNNSQLNAKEMEYGECVSKAKEWAENTRYHNKFVEVYGKMLQTKLKKDIEPLLREFTDEFKKAFLSSDRVDLRDQLAHQRKISRSSKADQALKSDVESRQVHNSWFGLRSSGSH